MSKYSGLEFAVFIVDGYDLLPSLMENASMADEIITQPTTPFGVDSPALLFDMSVHLLYITSGLN